MAPFDIKELRDLTAYDELELDTLGEKKTALFVIISDTDATFNFIVSIMYSQLFNLLCDKADDVYNGRLPIHVRCLLDEFANIGQIPQFEKLIATIRSREISASIILQSKSQLKALYRDNASTIEGNCDTTLFLGGKEKDTLKDLAEILGKETIDLYNTSDTRGTSQSYGLNYQKTGKELMSQDEIAVMEYYELPDLKEIIERTSEIFDMTITPEAALELARRSRGTPRIANRLLKRVRDYAQIMGDGIIDDKIADKALTMLDVDHEGLDYVDQKILRTMIEMYGGGPVGLGTLSVNIAEERETVEDMYEPYLIQKGFIMRTRTGRVATVKAYEHMGYDYTQES